MIARHWFSAFGALAITLGLCRAAYANGLAPYIYLWPGIYSFAFILAFPASLLAAFIERPFLTAAGIKRRPLVLSLRANFVSTVVGILLLPFGITSLYTIGGFLWFPTAFGVSCLVEITYLRRCSRQSFDWRWAVGGNVISNAVLMIMPVIVIELRQKGYLLAWSLRPQPSWLALALLGASLVWFLISFVIPVSVKNNAESSKPESAAPTIGEVQSEDKPIAWETKTGP